MLSLFPQLYDWSWYVPLLFRIFLSLYLFMLGYRIAQKGDRADRERFAWIGLGALLILLGASFFLGLYVQLAGAATFVGTVIVATFFARSIRELHESRAFYTLFALVAFSLIFLGAGPYAFDLPL